MSLRILNIFKDEVYLDNCKFYLLKIFVNIYFNFIIEITLFSLVASYDMLIIKKWVMNFLKRNGEINQNLSDLVRNDQVRNKAF